MALYRHHEGQMTTYELTMGQIQTAKKHLALLDERPDVPDADLARRNFLLMLARSYAVLEDQPASRTLPAPGAEARSGPDPPAVGRAQARGVRRAAMKFALVTEIPAPYRIPLFNALAERLDLLVLFLAAEDPRRSFYDLHEQEWKLRARRGARSEPAARRPLARAQPRARRSPAAVRARRGRRRRLEPAGLRAHARVREDAPHPDPLVGREHCTRRAQRPRRRSSSRSGRSCARTTASSCPGRRRSTTCGRSASSRSGSRSPRTPSTRACSPAPREAGDGTVRFPLRRAGSTRRKASTCCCGRSRTCRASSSSSARARRRPSCGHSPATESGSRARCRETRSQSGIDAPTRSCCRRARSRGGWC